MDIEKLAKKVEAHEDYRVLRRVKSIPMPDKYDPEKMRHGVFLDVETQGLKDTDEVIELCMYPFDFDTDGNILGMYEPLHAYNEPKNGTISPEITELTGITAGMVEGKHLPIPEIEELLLSTQLVVAHHASFDRPHAERISKKFEEVCWGCSMEQVPWKGSKRLETLLAGMGLFYEAHNATTDCFAGIRALAEPVGDKSALAHLLENSRKTTYHTWALNAPFDKKDALKARGYFWNGGEDGRAKAWHKEISDLETEEQWLRSAVYGGKLVLPARFDPVNAFNRFSRRQ